MILFLIHNFEFLHLFTIVMFTLVFDDRYQVPLARLYEYTSGTPAEPFLLSVELRAKLNFRGLGHLKL